MKMLPLVITSAVAGFLVSAMVFAAPVSNTVDGSNDGLMNRAAAYQLAAGN